MVLSFHIDKYFIAEDLVKKVCNSQFSNQALKEIVRNLSNKADLLVLEDITLQNEIAKACLQISEHFNFEEGKATAKYLHAKSSSFYGNNEEAVELLNDALSFFVKSNNRTEISRVLLSLADAYEGLKNYEVALKNLFECVSYFEKTNQKEIVANVYTKIGTCFYKLGNHSKSILFFNKALAIYNELKEANKQIAYCLLNIGVLYQNAQQPILANQYYDKVIDLTKRNKDSLIDGLVFFNKAILFANTQKNNLAIQFFEKSLELREKVNNVEGAAECYFSIAKLYVSTKEYNLAIKNYLLAYHKFTQLNDIVEMSKCCSILSKLYELSGDYKSALKYERDYSDLIRENDKRQIIKNNSKLVSINEKIDKDAISQIKKQVKARKSKSKESLNEFVNNVTHDLKAPLRSIIMFSQQLEHKLKNKTRAEEEFLRHIIKSGVQMSKMIDDMRSFALLDSEQLELTICDLNNAFDIIELNLTKQVNLENASIDIQTNFPKIYTNKTKFIQLFQNLISNGIKFKKPNELSKIKVAFNKSKEYFTVSVQDNGIGIEKESQLYIFELFKRLPNAQNIEGTGVGLAICKKIANELNANIRLESLPNVGSTFYIDFPMNMLVEAD